MVTFWAVLGGIESSEVHKVGLRQVCNGHPGSRVEDLVFVSEDIEAHFRNDEIVSFLVQCLPMNFDTGFANALIS